jgi:hypothetical protein
MGVKRLRHPRRSTTGGPTATGPPPVHRRRLVFLGSLFFLALSGFLLEAFRIADTNPSFEVWSRRLDRRSPSRRSA